MKKGIKEIKELMEKNSKEEIGREENTRIK